MGYQDGSEIFAVKFDPELKGCSPSDQMWRKCMTFSCGSEIGGEFFAFYLQYYMLWHTVVLGKEVTVCMNVPELPD